MNEAGFRGWLEQRRWNDKPLSKKGIDNRIRRMRRIERSLVELDFQTADVDVVISAGRGEELLSRIRELIRHSPSRDGVPQFLVPQANDPEGQLRNILAVLRLYLRFSAGGEPDASQSGSSPLEELRDQFLQRCPDFHSFDDRNGTYWDVERHYKDQILEKVQAIIASPSTDEEIGRPLYEAMMPNQGPLLRWQTRDDFDRNHQDLAPEFFSVMGQLARSQLPFPDALIGAAAQLQDLRARGADKLSPGEIAAIVFTTAACANPNATAPFKTTRAQQLAKRISGDRIFDSGPLKREQVVRWQELLGKIQSTLEAWGWKPRDLFDVQGFAWVALDESWDEDEADEVSDYDLGAGPYWFVGSSFGGNSDQTERFVRDGVWEIDTPSDKDAERVRGMKVGDRIALKATFVQRYDLPFNNSERDVSVMRIKARGTVKANPGDGERVIVAWDEGFEPRNWYFYTYLKTIWRVLPGKPLPDALIRFAFFDEAQDLEWFMTYGEWAKMYGAEPQSTGRRFWIEKTIVNGRPDRQDGDHALGKALWSPQLSKDGRDIYASMSQVRPGDVVFHLTDNRGITDVSVAAEAADNTFRGVPDTEWADQDGYRIPLRDHVQLEPPLLREAFLATEPYSSELKELIEGGAKGLFYNRKLELNQGAYLTESTPSLLSILNRAYQEYAGRQLPYVPEDDGVTSAEAEFEPYTLEHALEELFLDTETAEEIMLLWLAKKNIIIQGPPGVGKSFAAQRLAFAMMGVKDRSRLGFVQFHQSYSYEDFVEGFRPTAGGFELKAGKFVEFCRKAEADPKRPYVFIIDEINRGNLSKIMGELMLLIEGDKRDSDWAMPLASGKAPFHVPANVYLLGLMNTADRSLAVVDYALRRRFAFIDLAPNLSSPKFSAQLAESGIGDEVRDRLLNGIEALNAVIRADVTNLGPGFAIGHSFFCSKMADGETDREWYERVIRTEIAPLLREYWFDEPGKAEQWSNQLLTNS